MKSSEIKSMALECLKNKWKKVIIFVFFFILIEYILTSFLLPINKSDMIYSSINNVLTSFKIDENIAYHITNFVNKIVNIIFNLALTESVNYDISSFISYISDSSRIILMLFFTVKVIFETPLSYAFTISLMKFKRSGSIGKISFLENDNFRFKRAFSVEFRRILKLTIPIILLMITYIMLIGDLKGILKSYNYMQNILFYDRYSIAIQKYSVKFIIDIVLVCASAIFYYSQKLKYIMSFKISYDEPNLSAEQVVEKSKQIMMGHRIEYFKLRLSFIGWEILAYYTLCIGYLWLIPYIQISTICFYDKIKEIQQN